MSLKGRLGEGRSSEAVWLRFLIEKLLDAANITSTDERGLLILRGMAMQAIVLKDIGDEIESYNTYDGETDEQKEQRLREERNKEDEIKRWLRTLKNNFEHYENAYITANGEENGLQAMVREYLTLGDYKGPLVFHNLGNPLRVIGTSNDIVFVGNQEEMKSAANEANQANIGGIATNGMQNESNEMESETNGVHNDNNGVATEANGSEPEVTVMDSDGDDQIG